MTAKLLLIDDEPLFLDECAALLRQHGFDCDACADAEEGFKLLTANIYDVVICDVLIPFRGQSEGGILLARELTSRYPTSSIILVSQYVTVHLVNKLAGSRNFLFVEKGGGMFADLLEKLDRIISNKYCFVCMPFHASFADVYELGIKPVVEGLGFRCERADEIQHNRGIIEVICNRIAMAHLIVADMSGQNANVYYEVGFAHALQKEVILLTTRAEDIPFDLRGFNHLIYNNIGELRRLLQHRMLSILT